MTDAFAEHAGSYVVDRDGYLADLRHALGQQQALQERMLAQAEATQRDNPTPLGAERITSFRRSLAGLAAASEAALTRVPDPLGVALELDAAGTFRMAVEAPGGGSTGRGTWSVDGELIVLVHLEENGRGLAAPVTEALRIKGGALEKRASEDHFPFFLRRVVRDGQSPRTP